MCVVVVVVVVVEQVFVGVIEVEFLSSCTPFSQCCDML
jgi:hypothetical protein